MKNFFQKIIFISVFCAVTTGFGILAYYISQTQNPEAVLQAKLIDQNQCITKAFFSPDDHPKELLIDLIRIEKKQILTAIYTFTDKDIAQAFLEAHNRGVNIEIVADRNYGSDKFSRISQLANNKVAIWVYQTSEDEKQASLMHDKFCIFEDNLMHKSIVWTGSFNFTRRASNFNQENIIVIDRPEIVNRFTKQFQVLKERSLLISGSPQHVTSKPEQKIEIGLWEKIICMLGWSQ